MPASSAHDWTSDVIAQLRQLWDEGHTTAEIGRRLGVSKNAVVGKAHRLRLPPRPTPIRHHDPGQSPPAHRVRTVPELADISPPLAPMVSSAEPLPTTSDPLEDVTVTERPMPVHEAAPPRYVGRITACCWPIGEPGRRGFRFCEEPSVPRKPYCQVHSRSAYVQTQDTGSTPARSQAVRQPATLDP